MGWKRQVGCVCATVLAALSLGGCASSGLTVPASAGPLGEPIPPTAIDDSMLCQALAERFVGLPAMGATRDTFGAGDASAGRWWVRRCTATARGADLEVRLDGPGWYWVDQSASGIAVTEQVPFRLSLVLTGRLHEGVSNGVFSLWLEPSAQPEVEVDSPAALAIRSANAWGDVLRLLPGVSPAKLAAKRFNVSLRQAFREQLATGATLTFDLRSGQADATLGRLAPGKTPRHPFEDERDWVINDRVLLAPGGTQVLGPITAGSVSLNVIVERGSGVRYRTICDTSLRAQYLAIASGDLSRTPEAAWAGGGSMQGLGERTAALHVEGCKFYLVVSTLEAKPTLASIRVRS